MQAQINCDCGSFETDPATRLLVPSYTSFFYRELPKAGYIFFFLSNYVSLLLFRYNGNGRIPHDAFTFKRGVVHQLVLILILLLVAGIGLTPMLISVDAYWYQVLFFFLIPGLLCGFIISYVIPWGLPLLLPK